MLSHDNWMLSHLRVSGEAIFKHCPSVTDNASVLEHMSVLRYSSKWLLKWQPIRYDENAVKSSISDMENSYSFCILNYAI